MEVVRTGETKITLTIDELIKIEPKEDYDYKQIFIKFDCDPHEISKVIDNLDRNIKMANGFTEFIEAQQILMDRLILEKTKLLTGVEEVTA